MERVFHGANDETTCLDWSSDSQILAVGSKDMAVKLYPLEKYLSITLLFSYYTSYIVLDVQTFVYILWAIIQMI